MSVNHNSVGLSHQTVDGTSAEVAKPLHLQKLDHALDVRPFLQYVGNLFDSPASEPETSDSESDAPSRDASKTNGEKLFNGVTTTKQERRSDKLRLYNFSQVAGERVWLRDVLVTDSEDSEDESNWNTDEHIKNMLYYHKLRRKYQKKFYSNPDNIQYQYYGAGLLSNFDKFNEHQKAVIGNRKKRRKEKLEVKKRGRKPNKDKMMLDNADLMHLNEEERNLLRTFHTEEDDEGNLSGPLRGPRGRRRKQQLNKSPEVMAQRRRKIWAMMAKKEMGKVQRAKANNHKEQLTSCRRVAQYCMRYWRQKAMQSQKNMKETVWRLKRLTREMQAYWKRYDRVERETRKRMEKEAEEQRKMDVELMEAKRQQRKLNFLITQTELYAHFMSRKFGSISSQEQLRILSHLDEEKNPRLAAVDDYDSETIKMKVKQNVSQAFRAEQKRTMQFSASGQSESDSIDTPEDRPQPDMFQGNLKHYQLKGLSWVANLYDQGINGILADEMGLGKTVQSIAVLCHIAEKYGIWGPFLIISPASTLHNWQQEMARFVPDFKVVPYWGNPQERKILRGFWDQKDMHTKEASFHVVITSYQLVIQDFKYFNRIKWQYMILDEAQAIKSTSSVRWKLLQSFSCRNRLLLSGTPIQNSMAELWALLHFIMPTLFDSHDEFNEWFSKDIESHAENKTAMDEKHLTRLHMILKPFMLRRIKKDVENELSDKIEVMVYCPLTTRQKLLYSALKKKIRIEDLLQTGSSQSAQSVTSSLMNLVMQFRKVCNHPELFERREAKSPFFMQCESYIIPKLVAEYGLLHKTVPSKQHLLLNKLNLFVKEYIHRSIFPNTENGCQGQQFDNSPFAFAHFLGITPQELYNLIHHGILYLWQYAWQREKQAELFCHFNEWQTSEEADHDRQNCNLRPHELLVSDCNPLSPYSLRNSSALRSLVFTGMTAHKSTVYTHTDYSLHSMSETVEHRLLRSRKAWAAKLESSDVSAVIKVEPGLVDVPVSSNSPSKHSPRGSRSPSKSPRHNTSSVQSTTTPVSPVNVEDVSNQGKMTVLPEFPHVPRPPHVEKCVPTNMPPFLFYTSPKVTVLSRDMFASSRAAAWDQTQHLSCGSTEGRDAVWLGPPWLNYEYKITKGFFAPVEPGGLAGATPFYGWSNVIVPDKQTLVTDAGKLYVLDGLLKRLKEQGHRVLIYSQMTRMIDLLEEYMWHKKHTYMRLDGSSKISERRDMVADFQARTDIFVFLLSTRAGGLGINLTAADTVIFYDSDWNPTVDQQAMDRAHRLGQTKQVTVYRLICKGSIEERILQRAREKSEIQRMVISGGNFKPDTLKPKEVVSLLLDDEEIEHKYRQKQRERRLLEEAREREKKRPWRLNPGAATPGSAPSTPVGPAGKRPRLDDGEDTWVNVESNPNSPASGAPSESSFGGVGFIDEMNDSAPDMDALSATVMVGKANRRPIRGSRRGRPRGPRRGVGRGRLDAVPSAPGSGTLTGELPATPSATGPGLGPSATLSPAREGATPQTLAQTMAQPLQQPLPQAPVVRRGPGRPRLKPSGPPNQGTRGIRRPRKPVRPLPVPLGRVPMGRVPQGRVPQGRVGRVPPEMLLPPAPAATETQPQSSGIGFYTQLDSSG